MKEYFIAFQYVTEHGALMAGHDIVNSDMPAGEALDEYIDEKCRAHGWFRARMTITAFNAV